METTEDFDTGNFVYTRWPIANVRKDLIEQGGLEAESLDISGTTQTYLTTCTGTYDGKKFGIRWLPKDFGDCLVLSLESHGPEIVKAFEKILGYGPFASYSYEDGVQAVEWDKVNPSKRYVFLEQDKQRRELKRLNGKI